MGGVNGDVFLADASASQIDDLVRSLIECMAPGGGFIMHVIPGVYAGVPWDRVLSLVDAWKKYA